MCVNYLPFAARLVPPTTSVECFARNRFVAVLVSTSYLPCLPLSASIWTFCLECAKITETSTDPWPKKMRAGQHNSLKARDNCHKDSSQTLSSFCFALMTDLVLPPRVVLTWGWLNTFLRIIWQYRKSPTFVFGGVMTSATSKRALSFWQRLSFPLKTAAHLGNLGDLALTSPFLP